MANVTKTCRDILELTEQGQAACNLFMQKGKEQGLNELFSNPRYAEYLKHDIDDLYYNLRYMK